MIDVKVALRQLAGGALSFDDLVAQFKQATFTPRQPTKGDWGAVYTRAEEGDDTDVPGALAAAKFARQLTAEQYAQLMDIYRQRVTQAKV